MFKIVKTSTLSTLQTAANQVPVLREQLGTAQQKAAAAEQAAQLAAGVAETARAEVEKAQAELKKIENDRVLGLAELRDAVQDPNRRASVRGQIAVKLLRGLIDDAEAAAAKHGQEIDPGLRMVRQVLLDEGEDGTVQEAPENRAGSKEPSNA